MTRSTQCWLHGGCCSSTSRLCESTHTNSSALVTFVLTVSSELYRPSRRTGSELSEPALRLLYVEVDVCERIVSCWMAILMSSSPPPAHGILAGVARCREREWFELARDRALRLVTPAASRSSGSGPSGPPARLGPTPPGELLPCPVSDMLACPDDRFSSDELWHSFTRCRPRKSCVPVWWCVRVMPNGAPPFATGLARWVPGVWPEPAPVISFETRGAGVATAGLWMRAPGEATGFDDAM
uniref:Uncharacterized protein n=1 Tax=Anopheles melas TaxID=34690 RepID=A0A182UJL0_9DIPT